MIIIGLTGGIATGKSTVARQFEKLGAAVYDADRAVHRLLAKGGAGVAPVGKAFPKARVNDAIDRKTLSAEVFGKPAALKRLERILHPLVWKEERAFLTRAQRRGRKFAVLEIPLLFETGADARCDYVVLTWAPSHVQKRRALSRSGMSEEKLRAILARQMPHALRRRNADFVIHTGLGKAYSLRRAKTILQHIEKKEKR